MMALWIADVDELAVVSSQVTTYYSQHAEEPSTFLYIVQEVY